MHVTGLWQELQSTFLTSSFPPRDPDHSYCSLFAPRNTQAPWSAAQGHFVCRRKGLSLVSPTMCMNLPQPLSLYYIKCYIPMLFFFPPAEIHTFLCYDLAISNGTRMLSPAGSWSSSSLVRGVWREWRGGIIMVLSLDLCTVWRYPEITGWLTVTKLIRN